MKTPILTLAAAFVLMCTLNAQNTGPTAPDQTGPIKWQSTLLESKVEGPATETSYEFRGVNNTKTTVKIVRVNKSCGCQSVEQSAETIPPGGPIVLKGKISLQPYRGVQIKSLQVETQIANETPQGQALLVRVTAPEGVKVEPQILVWEEGDNSPKEVKLIIPPDNTSRVGEIKSLSKEFTFTEKQEGTGKILTVTPPANASRTAIRVETDTDGNKVPHYVRLEKRGATPTPTPTPTPAPATSSPNPVKGLSDIRQLKILLLEALQKVNEIENAPSQ